MREFRRKMVRLGLEGRVRVVARRQNLILASSAKRIIAASLAGFEPLSLGPKSSFLPQSH